jgi:acyl-CoA synthetase (AMP-forming)/AMP-acid ligase II
MLDYLKKYKGTSIICNDRSFSFVELNLRIEFYKVILNKYSNKVIGIATEFDFESISLLLALSTTNNIAVPLVYTTEAEFQNKIFAAKINILFKYNKETNLLCDQEIGNEIHLNFKPGVILFSSGTTGTPKMMFHEFSKIFKILEQPSKRQRDIRILLFLMFDHIGGINTLLNCIKDGSTIIIPSLRTPDYIINLINKYNVNVLPTTPTFLNLMLINISDNFDKINSLKLISYGTERMPESVLIKIKRYFPHVKLLQTFGTSETGILKTISKSSDSLYFKIDDDRYSYKIVEDVLFIKSAMTINGYLNQDSDKFDKDGWYNTGDIIKVDDDGYLMVIGRINEIINVGGLKVLPTEIEKVLMEFDGVLDCMVYGEFNVLSGQMVSSKIVFEKSKFVNIEEIEIKKSIKRFCNSKLDKFKVPVRINFVDKIEFTNRFKKAIK